MSVLPASEKLNPAPALKPIEQPVEELYRFLPFDWSGVSGVADSLIVVLNAILIFSVYQAYRSVRSSENARTTDILIWAISQMEEIKPDIAIVRQITRPLPRWSKAQREAAARVSVRLQRLAYMTRCKLIDPDHFRRMWAITFVDMWDHVAPWVMEVRASHGEPLLAKDGAFSRKDFEELVAEYRPYVDDIRRRGSASPRDDADVVALGSDL